MESQNLLASAIASRKKSLRSKKIIQEQELRAFMKCSEFNYRGGLLELPLKTAIIEFAYIRLMLNIMRTDHFDYKFQLNRVLREAHRHLSTGNMSEEDTNKLLRSAAAGVDQIFRIIPPNLYVPVFGPFEYQTKVSDTNVLLKVAGILATKMSLNNKRQTGRDPDYRSQTLHAVSFSPFHTLRDMESDLVQQIKAITLGNANPMGVENGRPQVRLHLFSASPTGPEVHYTYIEHRTPVDYKTWADYLERPMKLMESTFHYPLSPCPYACPFKADCYPNPYESNKTIDNELI